MSPAEEAIAINRRKELYEELYPETRATRDGGPFRGNQHAANVVKVQNPPTTFTSATVSATGKGESSIKKAAARGESGDRTKSDLYRPSR